ncbi:MAG TPA: hypothetical protein VJ201_01550, partial [Candidatus Babeliales bacterium]|nr:hypothetical protein [Candidatus Babeliales bacterium]
WVKLNLERYIHRLKNKFLVWYAGVDKQFWMPNNKEKNKNVLIYWKTEPESFCIDIEKTLRKHRWNPIRIKYGTYSPDQFKLLLNQSQFAVFISKSESQGIALAEAWSMNVPTIVWNPQVPIEYLGVRYKNVSSCPYLTFDTGIAWKSLDELEVILSNISLALGMFKPREWVLKNMTDEVSAQMLIDIIIESFKK